jgi:hypothetical protein
VTDFVVVLPVADLMAVMMVVVAIRQLHNDGRIGGAAAQQGQGKYGSDQRFHGLFLDFCMNGNIGETLAMLRRDGKFPTPPSDNGHYCLNET